MFGMGPATRIYLAAGATDMRKGFEGLYGLVRHQLQLEPLSGHIFIFSNAHRTRLKLLFWDGSGLWVCAKRLEKGRFRWPEAAAGQTSQGFALISLRDVGVEGVRSQNGSGVRTEESADFFQLHRELLGVPISEVLSEDQKVAAFLDGPLGHVHESCFVGFAPTTESFGNVGRNGYRCATQLQTEPVGLLSGKRRGESVRLQHEPMSLLPYQQILKRPGWFGNGHRTGGVHGGMLLVSHHTGVCYERLR